MFGSGQGRKIAQGVADFLAQVRESTPGRARTAYRRPTAPCATRTFTYFTQIPAAFVEIVPWVLQALGLRFIHKRANRGTKSLKDIRKLAREAASAEMLVRAMLLAGALRAGPKEVAASIQSPKLPIWTKYRMALQVPERNARAAAQLQHIVHLCLFVQLLWSPYLENGKDTDDKYMVLLANGSVVEQREYLARKLIQRQGDGGSILEFPASICRFLRVCIMHLVWALTVLLRACLFVCVCVCARPRV